MTALLLLFASVVYQDTIPYKASEEFELKLNFQFKDRPRSDPNKLELDQTTREYERAHSAGQLPYLFLDFRVLKQQPQEIRVRVLQNNSKVVHNKKVDTSQIVKLELGFTDDIKDHVGPYEYTILLMDEDKRPVSRIVINFKTDGTYLVNGQMRGKI